MMKRRRRKKRRRTMMKKRKRRRRKRRNVPGNREVSAMDDLFEMLHSKSHSSLLMKKKR